MVFLVLLVLVRLAGVRLDSIQSPSPGVPGGGGPLDHWLGMDMVVSVYQRVGVNSGFRLGRFINDSVNNWGGLMCR